jgi:hypothetical protein
MAELLRDSRSRWDLQSA